MKIVLGCSMKYRNEAKEVFKQLENLGHTPLFPNLFHTEDNEDKATDLESKLSFAEEHYRAIDESDVCYWLTIGNRLGTSCILELGYAIAKERPVYFSHPTNDFALDANVKEFIPIEKLSQFNNLS